MTVEIDNKSLKEMSQEDLLQIVILEGVCNVIEHKGIKIWNEPIITDFNNTMFSDTLVLDYNSFRVSDNMKSADYTFFFDFKSLAGDIDWYSSDIDKSKELNELRKQIELVRGWGEEWKNLAKSLFNNMSKEEDIVHHFSSEFQIRYDELCGVVVE